MAKKYPFKKTNNFYSRQGRKPSLIVLHITLGKLPGVFTWFQNPDSQVSAHYVVGKDGKVTQIVEEKDAAWHAGRIYKPSTHGKKFLKKSKGKYVNPNLYSIGIENEAEAGDGWTEKQMNSLVKLVKDVAKRNNIPLDKHHVVIHRDIALDKPDISNWHAEVFARLQGVDREDIKKQIIALLEKL